ncbi:MAG: alpha/beta hydrolase [Aaplasma endosymbiont of Hyalomma asiaticum]
MTTKLNGPCYRSGDKADSLVVLLHGRGVSGDNMVAIAPYMSKVGLKNAQFVAPHAPLPYGPAGYTWFTDSLRNMEEGTAVSEIMQSVNIVNWFIDEQLRMLDLSDSQLALVGFSQGAMLSVYVGLSRAKRCAAVVAYSGAVPFPHTLGNKILSRPDVCVVHGKNDEVIPFCYFEECVSFLRNNNIKVEALGIDSLDHSINNQGLEVGARFIVSRVQPQ